MVTALAPVHAHSASCTLLAAHRARIDAKLRDQAFACRAERNARAVEIERVPLQKARIQKHTKLACKMVVAHTCFTQCRILRAGRARARADRETHELFQ